MTQEAIALRTTGGSYPGLSVIQDINKALATLGTDFAGPDDPASLAGPYMTWADTGTDRRRLRNAANTAWIDIGGLTQPHASSTNQGLVKLSTLELALAGLDDAAAMTAANVAAAVPKFSPHTLITISSNQNFTVPAGIYWLDVEVWGGGGSGGWSGAAYPTGGGAGGGYARKMCSVTPGQVIACTVGVGGAGAGGQAGGTTSFGSFLSAAGGGGGGAGGALTGGAPGTGSGGDINLSGGYGGSGSAADNLSGAGGDAPRGGQGSEPFNGSGGAVPGGGGGGKHAQANGNGAPGGQGLITIRY